MGIEINWLNETKRVVLSLDEMCIKLLQPSFDILKFKTGIIIDQYSDVRLSPEHAGILLESMDKAIQISVKKLYNFSIVLKEAIIESKWIMLTGD